MKAVRIRPQADKDIDDLADYIANDSFDTAVQFLDASQKAVDLLSEQPGIGSLRYSHLPMLKGLRVFPVADFEKHLIFYIEYSDFVDVLRVLHGARDIAVTLLEQNQSPAATFKPQ